MYFYALSSLHCLYIAEGKCLIQQRENVRGTVCQSTEKFKLIYVLDMSVLLRTAVAIPSFRLRASHDKISSMFGLQRYIWALFLTAVNLLNGVKRKRNAQENSFNPTLVVIIIILFANANYRQVGQVLPYDSLDMIYVFSWDLSLVMLI